MIVEPTVPLSQLATGVQFMVGPETFSVAKTVGLPQSDPGKTWVIEMSQLAPSQMVSTTHVTPLPEMQLIIKPVA